VTLAELWTITLGALQGLGGITVFLLVVLIGFCLLLDRTKFRATLHSRTTKNLGDHDKAGKPVAYLPPDAPRGPIDQLANSIPKA
jgi:hypothetical protein